MTKTPFKMKGWSHSTQKTHSKHPVTPPTEKESKRGTVRPRTTEDRVINAISGSRPYRAMAWLESKFSGKSKATKKK